MSFGERLKEIRYSKNLTQRQLAELINVANTAISNYEKDISFPNTNILYRIFDVLDCDPNFLFQDGIKASNNIITLGIDEKEMIARLRTLSFQSNRIVKTIISHLSELETHNTNPDDIPIYPQKHYSAPYYDLPVSAGTGEFLDSEHYIIAELTEEPPRGTNFIVRVSGDSMEPTYHDGDKLFIKQQHDVDIGEIGIFMIDGDVYVKELAEDGLISHNKKYNKIPFHEYNNIRCYGKVLGICTEDI